MEAMLDEENMAAMFRSRCSGRAEVAGYEMRK